MSLVAPEVSAENLPKRDDFRSENLPKRDDFLVAYAVLQGEVDAQRLAGVSATTMRRGDLSDVMKPGNGAVWPAPIGGCHRPPALPVW